jgi:hypothetical protein
MREPEFEIWKGIINIVNLAEDADLLITMDNIPRMSTKNTLGGDIAHGNTLLRELSGLT